MARNSFRNHCHAYSHTSTRHLFFGQSGINCSTQKLFVSEFSKKRKRKKHPFFSKTCLYSMCSIKSTKDNCYSTLYSMK